MKKMIVFLMVMAVSGFSMSANAEITGGALIAKTSESSTLKALDGLRLRQHSGVVSEFDQDAGNLIIKNRKGEFALDVNDETQVKRGREKLGQDELKPGMTVTVRYWEKEGRKIARIVKLSKD